MFKKITAIVLILMLCLSSAVFAADEHDYMKMLKTLGAIDYGSDYPMDSQLTRAQFTKMAVMVSQNRDFVATNLSVAPFVDVSHKHWGAPYIHIAVTNGIINGYIDGTFKPEDPIKYEEAVTIALKILGYTNADFGASWPNGQLGMANKLGLTDNIDAKVGSYINRKNTINLLYNTICTPQKGASSDFVNTLGYVIKDDVTIIATNKEDSSVKTDNVYTSAGTYKIGENFNYDAVGKVGTIVLDGNELILFFPGSENRDHHSYTVYAPLANDVLIYKDGNITNLGAPMDTTVFSGGGQTTLKAVLQALDIGYTLNVSKKADGFIDYITVQSSSLEGPYIASSSVINSFANVNAVIKDGVKTSISALAENDVLYYSKSLSTVWAYSKKVTGIYESASPNKDTPQSVTVSGKVYAIEGANAYNALSSAGSLNYGDTITLLLGRNGDVAGVAGYKTASSTEDVVGYLIDTGEKQFVNSNGNSYSSLYVSVVQTDGNVYEYTTRSNYSSMKNSIVSVSFKDGNASLKQLKKQNTLYGKVSYDDMLIGNYKFADNVQILDISSPSASEPALYKTIFVQRLDGTTLSASSILYFNKNKSGEIDKMILNDYTGDIYTYGIVTKADKASTNSTYSYITNGVSSVLNSSATFSVSSGQPAKFVMDNGRIDSIIGLTLLGNVTSLDVVKANIGSKSYLLSDKVVVYEKSLTKTYSYLEMPIYDLIENQDEYTIRAYVDDSENFGGRIRVLIAQKR